MFNDCCGASHLMPTAISSSGAMRSMAGYPVPSGALQTDAANAYSMYSLPYNMNHNIPLQFSATYSQPVVDIPRIYNLRSVGPVVSQSMSQNVPKKQERPSDTLSQLSAIPIKYLTTKIIERQPKKMSAQQMTTSNAKPVTTTSYKPQTVPTTPSPNYVKYRNERLVTKPTVTLTTQTTRRPKMTTETKLTTTPAVNYLKHNNNNQNNNYMYFHWPKNTQQSSHQNYGQKDIQREKPQQQPQQQTQTLAPRDQMEKLTQDTNKYFMNQHVFEYNTESPQMQTQFVRQESPITTTVAPKVLEPLTTTAPQEYREEIKETSDKKETLAPIDSEQTYQFFDDNKDSNPNYEPIVGQQPEQLSSYSSPTGEDSNGVPSIDQSYPHFANPESDPEPEVNDNYDNNNDKELSDHLSTEDNSYNNNDNQLKSLLEQFIVQLDMLRSVATRELSKSAGESSGGQSYGYHKNSPNTDVISQTVIDPSVSKTGVTYDDYQNERSFEQNLANSELKSYKDSYDKLTSKKPCKKAFHTGALQYPGVSK